MEASSSKDRERMGLEDALFGVNSTSGTKTKTSFALETLRNAILDGRFDPGSRFDVRDLSRSLQMSVTPVREALRILEAEGLVTHSEHKQISVVEARPEDAQEVYELRILLESSLAASAAEALRGGTEHGELDEILALFDETAAKADQVSARSLNRKWHMYIYQRANRRYTLQIVERLWSLFDWTGIWNVQGRLDQSAIEHREITAAILAGDAEKSRRLMAKHISGGATAVNSLNK